MKHARVALVVLVAIVLAASTFLQKINPSFNPYSQWWFILLMALLGIAAIIAILQGKMWHRPSLLLIHAAVPVILLGGALSTWTAQRGQLTLLPNQASNIVDDNGIQWQLPFDVTLNQFEVIPYSGTRTPMDFVSHVIVDGQQHTISMNHILRHRGYRFYQSDYGTDGSSTLSVSHDPWGIGATYCGYLLLTLGLLFMLISPNARFRRLIRGAAIALLLLLPSASNATPHTLPRSTAAQMGQMMMLYKGRVCPVQTFAKDFTTKLTGKASYHGLSAEQVLSGFLFYYDQWATEPLVKIKGNILNDHNQRLPKHAAINDLLFIETAHLSPSSDKNLRAAAEKYNLVRMLSRGTLLKIYPVSSPDGISWHGQNDQLPLDIDQDQYLFIRRSLSYCQELILNNDIQSLENVFAKTLKYQHQQAPQAIPSPTRLHAEHLYNTLTTGRWLYMLSITLGLLAFAHALWRMASNQPLGRTVKILLSTYITALTAYLILIFSLRWIVGGHIPMAGSFDSMNLMAIALGIIALLTSRRHQMFLPIGMLTMGFCLLVAMISGSNPPVTNLMPVLNSPLLALHVTVIMFSYALFFAIAICSLAGLILLRRTQLTLRLQRISTIMLYPAVTLLAIGIMIGALWANISWGNYWSWDPKEVWALITLIVYALPLHSAISPYQRPAFFHLYCLLALLSVAITYFGVNILLGGLHAYN